MSQETNRFKNQNALSPRLPHIFYGGDYNPEQWPETVWEEDVRLMREAGVNVVSLGIFSWAKLEPTPGRYEFGWLDRIMDLLDRNGVKVDLATATASPPPWLAKMHPESLPVTREGVTLWPGGRQQYCPSSPAYRERAAALLRQIARRYQNHPALVMWHINNEYGCHVAECFCDTSAAAFRGWLKRRYATLEAFNEAWGTAFWSQHYSDWEEINPPRATPTFANPTELLDWKRFSSDALLECFEMEAAILREITPDVPVTTNFMNLFKPLDYFKWASREDLVSNDSYPDPADPASPMLAARAYDMMRSLGHGKPWLLMEQVTSQVNWRPQNVLKKPGQMRLWSYQALARGANGIMFFQWRASKAGAEKFHGAFVPHVGTAESRVWREAKQLGQELARLDALLDTRSSAQVAVLFDWESWWALETPSKPSNLVQMLSQLESYYAPLFRRNILVDYVSPSADLSQYRVVLAPNLYLVRDEDRLPEKLAQFVERGGRLVMSFFSGIVDGNEHIRLGGYPAQFRKLLGLWVEEFQPYPPERISRLEATSKNETWCSLWSDLIHLEGAEALATFTEGFEAGKPAVTRHKYGNGAAYYLGTRPDEGYMERLLANICSQAGVTVPELLAAGVEMVVRSGRQASYRFVLNHNTHSVTVNLPVARCRDVLSGRVLENRIQLEPYGLVILEEPLSE